MFRNDRSLYVRNSSLSDKKIISMYPADTSFPVYSSDEFFSDACAPLRQDIEVDFSTTFSDNLRLLQRSSSHMATHSVGNENCDYVNHVGSSKDCYMCI